MNYSIYRLSFPSGVHLGERNLDESLYSICADTLFSALYIEALKMSAETAGWLYQETREGRLLLSDMFPYIGTTYFLPKPMKRPAIVENEGNSTLKKAFKKLSYVPMDEMGSYLAGKLDVQKTNELFKNLGEASVKTSVTIKDDETTPYHVGVYRFHQDAGLYFILGFAEKDSERKMEELLEALSFAGIGGKRSSGYGRFEFNKEKSPVDSRSFDGAGDEYMSLSISLPGNEELEAVMADARYSLLKRSGFVQSDTFAPEFRKKKDLYMVSAGSCFAGRFQGDIYDVADGGTHPVYRYAKPIFWVL